MDIDRVLYITSSNSSSSQFASLAQQLAREWDGIYVSRQGAIPAMQKKLNTDLLIVVGERITCYFQNQKLFFHPSMAVVRIKRMLLGENDVMVEACKLQSGDQVLDCTLGLGTDSIVFSFVVGDTGSVIGIESSPILARIVQHGLSQDESDVPEVMSAMRRVQVETENHLEYLRQMPDKSVDIVYFDPMFRSTVKASSSIDPLRLVGNSGSIEKTAIQEAIRVARKCVMMKERNGSSEFSRLGFETPKKRSSTFSYGVIWFGEDSM